MKNPRLILGTDDDKSMSSELHVTISKTLNRIDFTHIKQWGGEELFQVFPCQVEPLIKFLQQSKDWIDSGYKEKMKPESFNELKTS